MLDIIFWIFIFAIVSAILYFTAMVAYIVFLITLMIVVSSALITGTITAVVNYRRAVVMEIYCLKNAIYELPADENVLGYDVPRNSFGMLSDPQSIKRVFAAAYRYQHYMIKRLFSRFNVRVVRYLPAFIIQIFGYAAVTVLCLSHGLIFGIALMINKLRNKPNDTVHMLTNVGSAY